MTTNELVGFRTTFTGLFDEREAPVAKIGEVEIPLIQRDYAQGRDDRRATAIRGQFLDALGSALRGGPSVGLDFIYGDVDGTRFEPLDGQQRLTTLFLLHWYVAARLGILGEDHRWTKFGYATRPSARLFCERLVANPPPADLRSTPYSEWLKDQSWYLYVWRHDPTISAMLVTIDDIHARFGEDDMDRFWSRLNDDADPAIWFQMLPIEGIGSPADLYIKMNSRGKPLTEFEAFKAGLGRRVADMGRDDFGHLIDGAWTDVLWPYRGDDNVVDDEFMHYFAFLIEICEWKEGRVRENDGAGADKRVSELLAADNPNREEHLHLIYAAFDVWVKNDAEETFGRLLSVDGAGDTVRLFGTPPVEPNLFRACCERYGLTRGTTRLFSLTDTLLLLAVLVHLKGNTEDELRRLRVLRNVNEASQFEMRVQNMPKLVQEVEEFMRTGELSALQTFNQNQVRDERAKERLLASDGSVAVTLHRLEDHNILRGTLAAFTLDTGVKDRARVFGEVFDPARFPLLTAALLATGEYQRNFKNSDCHQLGSPNSDQVWRKLLVDRGDPEVLRSTGSVAEHLLDRVVASDSDVETTMQAVVSEFLDDCERDSRFDWRYYLVKYDEMREGKSGLYYGVDQRMGFELTMLRMSVQSSYYRDPYLYAMWIRAGKPGKDVVKEPWFFGYSTKPRWLTFLRSGAELRNTSTHLLVRSARAGEPSTALAGVCEAHDAQITDEGWQIAITQVDVDGQTYDTVDRVRLGAEIIKDLTTSGL